MAFYINHTRHNAIVTVHIQSTNNAEKSIGKGTSDAFHDIKAEVGYHDICVEPGLELKLGGGTTAVLLGTRHGD